MGRWSHLDSDSERLPEGMQRIGYDADSSVYTYRDTSDGTLWEGQPGNGYGRLRRAEQASPLPSSSSPSSPSSTHVDEATGRGSFSQYAIASLSSPPSSSSSRAPRRGGSVSSGPVFAPASANGTIRRSQTTRESRRQVRNDKDVEAFLTARSPPSPMAGIPRRANTVSRLVGLIRRRSSATRGAAGEPMAVSRPSNSTSPTRTTTHLGNNGGSASEVINSSQSSAPNATEPCTPSSLRRQTSAASSQTAWSRNDSDAAAGHGLGRQDSRLSRASTLDGERENDRRISGGGGARPRRATTFDEIFARV